jgi:hypothetical protein
VAHELSHDEYRTLSDQKAADWRSISEVNPTLFGVAGAIFAAGVAQRQPDVVALSPLPLYLGVWHMIRHARLQLSMITYLATHAPEYGSWEREIARVRPKFWAETRGKKPAWLAELMRPSAWNTWLVITVLISAVAISVPPLAGYSDACRAVWIGVPVSVVASVILFWQSRKIQLDREHWTRLWEERRRNRTAACQSEYT